MIWLQSVPAPSPLRAICRLSSLKDVSGQVSLLDIRHHWWRPSSWICTSCPLEPKCLSPTPQSLCQHKHPIQVQSHPLLIFSPPNPPTRAFLTGGPLEQASGHVSLPLPALPIKIPPSPINLSSIQLIILLNICFFFCISGALLMYAFPLQDLGISNKNLIHGRRGEDISNAYNSQGNNF